MIGPTECKCGHDLEEEIEGAMCDAGPGWVGVTCPTCDRVYHVHVEIHVTALEAQEDES